MGNPGIAKLVALSLALTVHGALAVALVAREEVQIEGGNGAAEVRLGNAFADMSAGTLSAEAPDATDVTEAARPQRIEAENPAPVSPITPTEPLPAIPSPPVQVATLVPSVRPEPTLPQPIEAQTPFERLVSEDPDSTALTRSARPTPRSRTVEQASRPQAQAKSAPKPQQAAPRSQAAAKPAQGNAQRNARAGEATGQADATARQRGSGGQQQADGNAAASNYPGLVMQKLARVGKPRVNARGAALVSFTIAANGGLASVSIARSSGSSALDQAALRLIQRASPFPRPPQGANRNFSVRIEGR
ncbi:TonB family protein [Paracoccus sp. 11-3]|uniref:TonB family protein n=1 Tax=Paracoccus amoyensis TaxID=2760093 RepID=A0A926GF71_9RHOB|nr:energy transducer TonB [Paracoccus amoyensis]MBC9245982.1 TonB family protein [Paracoccus amoyensis]